MNQSARATDEDLLEEWVAVIGAGKVGRSFIRALREQGLDITTVVDHHLAKAIDCGAWVGAEVAAQTIDAIAELTTFIIIAVPDDSVQSVANDLAAHKGLVEGCVVVHTSGALTSDALSPVRSLGAFVASMHPIQTFAGRPNDWTRLARSYFGLEGDEQAVKRASRLVDRIGGKVVLVPKEAKSLYHLACVFASNYTVALMAEASGILEEAGFGQDEALHLLTPLLKGTIQNLDSRGISGALTGPITRGDVGTVRHHLAVLRKTLPTAMPLYRELGKTVLQLAANRGTIDKKKLSNLRRLLSTTKATKLSEI